MPIAALSFSTNKGPALALLSSPGDRSQASRQQSVAKYNMVRIFIIFELVALALESMLNRWSELKAS